MRSARLVAAAVVAVSIAAGGTAWLGYQGYTIVLDRQHSFDVTPQTFLAAARSNDFAAARELFAANVRERADAALIGEIIRTFRLEQNVSLEITRRDLTLGLTTGRGVLEGTVQLANGEQLPMHVTLVLESGRWRIADIRVDGPLQRPLAAVAAGTKLPAIPTQSELSRLVTETLTLFYRAVGEGSMATLHRAASREFQAAVTVARLDAAFASFIAARTANAGDPLAGRTPVFSTPPTMLGAQRFMVMGHVPTRPNRINFELGYVLEEQMWKLVTIKVQS